MKKILFMTMVLFTLLFALNTQAAIKMDSIQFDPAIIAAGDQVDIAVQFYDDERTFEDDKIGEKDFTYEVRLESDDSLSEKYITIVDRDGDNLHGHVFSGGYYNKVFTVKVNQDAPAANYELKLVGRWLRNDVPETAEHTLRFKLPVKREGIILDVANILTVPGEVRPGDDSVKIKAFIENVGRKDAKSVEVTLDLPEGIKSSYSNNNRVWVGKVSAGESKEVEFYIDIDEYAKSGVYDIIYDYKYMDLDDNKYEKNNTLPFLINKRPYLEVINSTGNSLTGETSELRVWVKNNGEESAESIDVRIIKENTQPFVIDVRSDYIGELEPGEVGIAVFDIKVLREAKVKDHDLKLLIRSKGDSDEGDDTIYTYNRRATFSVVGEKENNIFKYGLYVAGVIFVLILFNLVFAGKEKKKFKKRKN